MTSATLWDSTYHVLQLDLTRKTLSNASKSQHSATWDSTYRALQIDVKKKTCKNRLKHKKATWSSSYPKLQQKPRSKMCQINTEIDKEQPVIALTLNCNRIVLQRVSENTELRECATRRCTGKQQLLDPGHPINVWGTQKLLNAHVCYKEALDWCNLNWTKEGCSFPFC